MVPVTIVPVRTILLVEDDPAWAELTVEAFSEAAPQVRVEVVPGGEDALLRLRCGKLPDLVVLDLNMPGLDGRDVLRAIRSELSGAVDVVVLSASVAESDRDLAVELGARSYLSKPTTFVSLRDLAGQLAQGVYQPQATMPAAPQVPPPAPRRATGTRVGPPLSPVDPARRHNRLAVVEDSPLDAALIADELNAAGFEVRCTDTIAGFRTSGLAEWAGCVLLDLDLPDASGLDGLRAVRAIAPAVPVILLTGNSSEALALEALGAGAQDWVRKGSKSAEQLARTIRFAVERARLQEELLVERELRRAAEEAGERHTEALAQSNAELSRSNADLAEFASIAAHDLRSPLQAISGFAGLLERGYSDVLDDHGREFLQHILAGADRMNGLIEDLLTYCRVGAAGPVWEPVDLGELFESVCSTLNADIVAVGASVTAGELPVVHGDQIQMTQLLQNLIANAIKFVAEGVRPQVHVAAERVAKGWTVSVTDNGIGVQPEHRQRIFAMFQRLWGRERFDGTGVGLAICKRVVERRGGTIQVEDAPGGGSRFIFTVPDDPRAITPTPMPAPALETGVPDAELTILLVEDGDDHAMLVDAILAETGMRYRLIRSRELAGARSVLAETTPDCVLLDLSLPDGEGLISVAEIRTAAPQVPLVILTALADERAAVGALRRGAQDYLVKGRIDPDTLTRTIRFAMERHAQESLRAEAALSDSLTGLPNRTLLLDRIGVALARAERGAPSPALLFFDLDGFKSVNDRFGHQAGDRLLVEVAERMRSAVRGTDTVARLHGDEFVVLCEELTGEEAACIGRRVVAGLAGTVPLGDDLSVTISASFGVAVGELGDTPETLLGRADDAMYEAKRNR